MFVTKPHTSQTIIKDVQSRYRIGKIKSLLSRRKVVSGKKKKPGFYAVQAAAFLAVLVA